MAFRTYFLVGGAGFFGSHFIDVLLNQPEIQKVTVYDNFSSGKKWHYQHHTHDPRFSVITGDAKDADLLTHSMRDHDVVIHFASNADISQAIKNPSIDFVEGFYLTYQVLEAARLTQVKRLLYTSGSGIYGDVADLECLEDQGPLLPISTYGASKLAGEAFISSYCHMFGLSACVFRFGNIVGSRQTHGVGYDFVRYLQQDPTRLPILGNGTQSKSYIHVADAVNAVLLANQKLQKSFEVYNVATGDYTTVREIAEIAVQCMGLQHVKFEFMGGDRGWAGDVPIVRLNTDRIRALGWTCQRSSLQAIKDSLLAMIQQTTSHLVSSCE